MAVTVQGKVDAKDLKFAIIVSRFNEMITSGLLSGALEAIIKTGGKEEDIYIVKVPGAFEIPSIARKLAHSKKWDAVICLGAVIKGETPHFEYIASAVTLGLAECSLQAPVPVTFGVLTTETVEQAIDRAGSKSGNKGYEAALTAVEMATLFKQI